MKVYVYQALVRKKRLTDINSPVTSWRTKSSREENVGYQVYDKTAWVNGGCNKVSMTASEAVQV